MRQQQLQLWISRLRSFCSQRQVYLLDVNIIKQSTLFQSGDQRFRASKQLQAAVMKQLVSQQRGVWTDSQQQAVFVKTVDAMHSAVIAEINEKATDDVITVQEAAEALEGGAFGKIPQAFLIVLLKEGHQEGLVGLMMDQYGKIEGIKLRR